MKIKTYIIKNSEKFLSRSCEFYFVDQMLNPLMKNKTASDEQIVGYGHRYLFMSREEK